MITVAIVSFAVLFMAWLLAPGEPAVAHRSAPTAEETIAEAA